MKNAEASARLAELQVEAIDLLAKITEAVNKPTPNADWGHVGSAGHLVLVLQEAARWAGVTV